MSRTAGDRPARAPGRRVPGTGSPLGPDVEGAGAIFEVFRQEKDGDAMRHAGNLRAPDDELATHYAREFYGRRQESARLWVVRRDAIRVVEDPDLLQPPLDRSFKKPGGYVMRDKLAVARARSGQAKPRAKAP